MTIDRRQALKAIASLGTASIFAPVLAACTTPAAASREPLTIGLIVPLSGPLQHIAAEMSTGFQVFLDGNGGALGGARTTVVQIDEGATPATTLANVTAAMTNNNLVALAGVAGSAALTALAPAVEQNRIPLLASGASPSSLGIPYKYIWRTSYVAGEAGTAMATYLSSSSVKQTIFIVDDGTPDGRAETKSFVLAMASAHMTYQQLSTPKITAGQLAQIVAFAPDAVFAACSGQAAVDLVTAYRAFPVKAPLYGPGSLTEGAVATGTLLDEEDVSALGIFTTQDYAADLDNPQNQGFAAAYFNATHPNIAPTTFAMTTYDAANVLDTVIPRISGELNRASLAAALRVHTQFASPRGSWEFNDQATPRQRWYLRQVQRDGLLLENAAVQAVDMLN